MKNYGIRRFKNANIDNFTSDIGMEIRKKINKPLRTGLKLVTKLKLIKYALEYEIKEQSKFKVSDFFKIVKESGIKVMNYPELDKDKPYIFASLHNFVDDSMANLATIDHNAYLLFGTSDQLEVNKDMYAAWVNGFVYVDRFDDKSRKESVLKMKKLLDNGNSVLIFPEGGLNNTENKFCQKLFSSPYYLSKLTGREVVPVAPLYEYGSNKIYMNVGEPIDLSKFDNKQEANDYLRDVLSSLLYENLLENTEVVERKSLSQNPRADFMNQRKKEYQKTKWTKDVWDEEITIYLDKDDKEMISVYESVDNIEANEKTAEIIAPVLVRRQEQKQYDFKNYMHNNWKDKK